MALSSVELVSRPLKIAFLVNPNNHTAVLEAISLSSILWGGIYNPIIKSYRKIPKHLARTGATAETMRQGYLDLFDPDYVCCLGEDHHVDPASLKVDRVSASDILLDFHRSGQTGLGISLLETLKYVTDSEFKYRRSDDATIVLPDHGRKQRCLALLAAKNGILNEDCMQAMRAWTKSADFIHWRDTEEINCTIRWRGNFDLVDCNAWDISANPVARSSDGPWLFLCDGSSYDDAIEYWNLRAIGLTVIAFPRQLADDTRAIDAINTWISRTFQPHPQNENIYGYVTAVKSSSINQSAADQLLRKLTVPKRTGETRSGALLYRREFPDLWDQRGQREEYSLPPSIECRTKSVEFDSALDSLALEPLPPPMLGKHRHSRFGLFANLVRIRRFGGDGLFAEVIPDGDADFARSLGFVGLKEWRASSVGLVSFIHYPSSNIRLNLKAWSAIEVIPNWLKSQKVEASLSSAGRLTHRAMLQLGPHGEFLLSVPAVISLLLKLQRQSTMKAKAFIGELKRAISSLRFKRSHDRYIDYLTRMGVVSLGVDVQCPTCSKTIWRKVENITLDIRCDHCLDRFNLPTNDISRIVWSYKIIGPLSASGKAEGLYPILLTKRVLTENPLNRTTICPSLDIKIDGVSCEIDLVALTEDFVLGIPKRCVCFVEAKTFGRFKQKDVSRMRKLSATFPGCTLIFSTLSPSLDKPSKGLLTRLVIENRKRKANLKPYSPVIILTGTELCFDISIDGEWEHLGGRHADIAKNRNRAEGRLDELAEVTSELYTDAGNYWEWRNSYHRSRRSRAPVVGIPDSNISLENPTSPPGATHTTPPNSNG
jgi:hypothetical protein